MTYSAVCSQPVCTVVTDDMSEMEMSLGELQVCDCVHTHVIIVTVIIVTVCILM